MPNSLTSDTRPCSPVSSSKVTTPNNATTCTSVAIPAAARVIEITGPTNQHYVAMGATGPTGPTLSTSNAVLTTSGQIMAIYPRKGRDRRVGGEYPAASSVRVHGYLYLQPVGATGATVDVNFFA